MKKFILLLLIMFLFQANIYAGNINVNQIMNDATRNIKLPSNIDANIKNNINKQINETTRNLNKQINNKEDESNNESNKEANTNKSPFAENQNNNVESVGTVGNVGNIENIENVKHTENIESIGNNVINNTVNNINNDVPIISIDKDEMATKREEILDEFKKKLNQNQDNNGAKNLNEVIQDDFATIIKKEDIEKKQKAESKQEEKLVNVANTPIVENGEEAIEEEEYKTKYIEELKNAIIQKKEEQAERFKKIISKTTTKADEIIGDAFFPKNTEKKASEEEISFIEKEIALENKQIIKKPRAKDDPEIFNITDTGVSKEIFDTKEFDNLLTEKINSSVIKPKNAIREIVFPIPVENQLSSFKQYTNSQEVLGIIRFEDSEKAFKTIDSEDFQEIAKKAIDEGDLSVLRSVVDFTKNADYILKNGQTLINYASNVGNLNMVKYLIFSGANLNVQDYNGNTALHNAILKNDYRIIKLLVLNNISLSTINIDGYTPLMLSVVYGKNNVALFLLKFKQNLLIKNYRKETVLDLTTKYNRIMIKELILEKLESEKNNKIN